MHGAFPWEFCTDLLQHRKSSTPCLWWLQKLSDEWHCTTVIVRFHVRWEHVSCTAILLHHVDAATPQRYKAPDGHNFWHATVWTPCWGNSQHTNAHYLSAHQVQVLLQLTSFPTTSVTKGTFLTCELRNQLLTKQSNNFSGFRRNLCPFLWKRRKPQIWECWMVFDTSAHPIPGFQIGTPTSLVRCRN